MKVTGSITSIKAKETGTTKAGKAWSKVSFLLETEETYNNLYCFDLFQMDEQEDEKKKVVDNFLKYNKVGAGVDVDFNIKTSEWNGKHFTSLAAWKIFKAEGLKGCVAEPADDSDGLPF